MIEAEADSSQVQVEVALRHSALRVQAALSVVPVAFDSVDVVGLRRPLSWYIGEKTKIGKPGN